MSEVVNIQQELNILKENLRQLNVSALCDLVPGIGDFLAAMGEQIFNEPLADAIVEIKGTSIFEDKNIREALCGIKKIETVGAWSKSPRCKHILNEFGLSEVFLPKVKKKREVIKHSSPEFKLHDYQDWVKREVSRFLILGGDKNKMMVQMPTGSGKTWTTMESIYDFMRISKERNPAVIWMAHTDELCEQAIESFYRGWETKGTFEVDLLRLWGGNLNNLIEIPEKPFFAVTSFQTANSMVKTQKDRVFELYAEIKKRVSLLIVDEAHQATAPTYKFSIKLLSRYNTKIIGLSATPGRHGIDEDTQQTEKLASFFDHNILTIKEFCKKQGKTPLQYLQDMGVLSEIELRQCKTEYKLELNENERKTLSQTLELPESVLKRASEDMARNGLIIAQIIRLVENMKKKVLVFASSKDNSDFLASLLILRGIKAKSVTGETNFTDRVSSVEMFREHRLQVLLNYNVFTAGFDDPKIDCIFIARPTYSVVLYSQMVGRGLRGPLNGGTKKCLLVDVIDNIESQPDINYAHDYFAGAWK